MQKSFKMIFGFESKMVDAIEPGNLGLCNQSFRIHDVFFDLIGRFIRTNINNRNLLMSQFSPQHIAGKT